MKDSKIYQLFEEYISFWCFQTIVKLRTKNAIKKSQFIMTKKGRISQSKIVTFFDIWFPCMLRELAQDHAILQLYYTNVLNKLHERVSTARSDFCTNYSCILHPSPQDVIISRILGQATVFYVSTLFNSPSEKALKWNELEIQETFSKQITFILKWCSEKDLWTCFMPWNLPGIKHKWNI